MECFAVIFGHIIWIMEIENINVEALEYSGRPILGGGAVVTK
jgi:uncharacterized membrane protein YagU involved in acid resistance